MFPILAKPVLQVLAGKILQSDTSLIRAAQGAGERTAASFPNLLVRNRDKPHGCRRIATRPFAVDSYLNKIAGTLINDEKAIMQVIRYSDVFRHRFAKFAKEMEGTCGILQHIATCLSNDHSF